MAQYVERRSTCTPLVLAEWQTPSNIIRILYGLLVHELCKVYQGGLLPIFAKNLSIIYLKKMTRRPGHVSCSMFSFFGAKCTWLLRNGL
jgi:hypothetical protein